ncbi:putative sigma-factor like protein [uncultured Mediterranean phage uvMED]|nr:putative sigma-factor like protein [uncultured Mediterranean phage uvMED]
MNSRLLAMNWDMTSLHQLYMEAATTLHRLPPVLRKKHSSLWPSYALANAWSASGYDNVVVIQPTTEDITRLEFALEIGWDLEKDDRVMLWYTAHSAVNRERGPKWKALSKRFHCDARTVKGKYEKALIKAYYLIKGLQS